MSKSKKGTKENPASLKDQEFAQKEKKDYVIKEASIHDDFCHYRALIVKGVGEGRTMSSINQSNIVKPSLRKAFSILNVHLACIDDVFKNNSIEIDDIDKFHNHELTDIYRVTGFKVKGGEENESLILIGSKHVSAAGSRIDIISPRIPLDNLSSYKWYNELKDAFAQARIEVESYHEGYYELIEVETEDVKTPVVQMTIGDAIDDIESEKNNGTASPIADDDFKNAQM